MNKACTNAMARIAENTIAPEPTDRPYVSQNRPLGPLFRQTHVILPTHGEKALEGDFG